MHVFLAIITLLLSAVALPTFDDFGRRFADLNSLIPDTTRVRVFARRDDVFVPHDLTLYDPDFPGNLTVIPDDPHPASFYIYKNRLWLHRNESAIWPVNLVDATQIPGYPLQMVVGTKISGIKQGIWSWQDTRLHYDHDGGWYSFYVCPTPNGHKGVFLFTTPAASADCDAITFSQQCR